MMDALTRVLGLKDLSLTDPDVRLEFARAMPPWAWVLLALALVGAGAWGYWRLVGKRWPRAALACVRVALLLLILAIIAGPQLVKQSERVERDWVVVMLDRSASMALQDAPGEGAARDGQLREALAAAWPTLRRLSLKRQVLVVGFDGGVFDLAAGADGAPELAAPAGRRTNLGRALEQVLRRVASRPVAGIVVLSDGRSAEPIQRAVVRQLEARQIPVFAAPLGSDVPVPDLAVTRVDAPSAAFVEDDVPVTVEVDARGIDAGSPWPAARVELVDAGTGDVLDSRDVPAPGAAGARARVSLSAKPKDAGQATWRVRVVPGGRDLSEANNTFDVRVAMVSRPIRVVCFDGYPRWEYRYLKNLAVRERSIRSTAMLLSADKRYIQEGTDPLDIIPRTPAQWAPIDVIVMGDLRPELFSTEQLKQIREHVASRGAGLLWLGGAGATPNAWRGTPLADLLPIAVPGAARDGGGVQAFAEPVVLVPAPGAERLGVLRLGESLEDAWPAYLSQASAGWWALRWAQRVEPTWLKPTTEVLAWARPISAAAASDRDTPVVLTMRFGAGRVAYVGTDEIWRYRYGRGEALPERFYLPILRMLARETLGRSGRAAAIEVSPEVARVDEPVRVQVRLMDQSLVERRAPSVRVHLRLEGDPRARAGEVEMELHPEGDADGTGAWVYAGTFLPAEPGRYEAGSRDPLLSGLELSASLTALLDDDELRTPQTDHPALAQLASSTGGRVVEASRLADVADLLPNRELRVLGTPKVETLWDKPLVWVLLMLLASVEWVGRRLIRLP